MTSIIGPDRRKLDHSPASHGQLVGIVTVALLGAAVGVSMLIIAYLSGHLNLAIWVYFIICEGFSATTGIIALILYLRRHSIITRATRLTMYPEHFNSEWKSYATHSLFESRLPAEDNADYEEAIALRDALISSGDLDLAYRIQNTLK
jgi:hypothetical protein